jgi:hypothetical protein
LTRDTLRDAADIEVVTFAPDSQLRELQQSAFSRFSFLKLVCIPFSVEIICRYCFTGSQVGVWPIRTVTFESGSRLREIKSKAF